MNKKSIPMNQLIILDSMAHKRPHYRDDKPLCNSIVSYDNNKSS